MKQFDVPPFYRSSLIGEIKKKRKLDDPRKKDFKPTQIKVDNLTFLIARHFGFCYGVENAIEKSYKAIKENPDKRIFLLSQMIHNPDVNEDLESHGLKFLQDTHGKQLIPFEELTSEDIVIIPAFGTTVEIEKKLLKKGIEIDTYNTTCPFVEKVWNRSAKLGSANHTIIIHGKAKHEETRATFSHSSQNSPSLVIKDITEAQVLADFILGKRELKDFPDTFKGNYSENFDPKIHLNKIGVVNQTTMLATETQEITDYLRSVMTQKFGLENIKEHMADTRDTLCYATNDNQSATIGLLEESVDLAVVVGGYNSSNTTHLVELLEQKFNTYFIRNESEIIDENQIYSFDIHTKERTLNQSFLPDKQELRIAITSGASCPDKLVDEVIHKIIKLKNLNSKSIQIKL
ncbi:MAG: 4-hydroxy-3-methylbut-2-enyl diphosphate reductase [Crocinitomicaceae bacterium]